MSLSANISVMFAKLLRKKFAGVQQPLAKHLSIMLIELLILSPLVFLCYVWLKLKCKEILVVGVSSPSISVFVATLEPELRKRQQNSLSLDKTIVLNLSEDANSHVRKMYDEIVNIYGIESRFRRRVIWWASKFGVKTIVPDQVFNDISWKTMKPSIVLPTDDCERGYAYLASKGIGKDQDFVCYATRTESYYLKLISQGVVAKPRSVRNPDEQIYLDVGSKLSEKGLPVIRMGKDLNTSLSEPNAIIDYASTNRTDALDCFLLSKCKFLINGATGIVWFRRLFNMPSLNCDIYDIRNTQTTRDLNLFQRVRFISSGKYATISEMLEMRSEYADERHQARLGIELVQNSFSEILDACDEMNQRIDGTWVTTKEDEQLHNEYLNLVSRYSDLPAWNGGGRVGTSFLRTYRDLLC